MTVELEVECKKSENSNGKMARKKKGRVKRRNCSAQ
jgi:hypothetical protein